MILTNYCKAYVQALKNTTKTGEAVRSPVGLAYSVFQNKKRFRRSYIKRQVHLSKEELNNTHAQIFQQDITMLFWHISLQNHSHQPASICSLSIEFLA